MQEPEMRDKLIDRIYKLAEYCGLHVMENLKEKSNDELLTIYGELIVEAHIFKEYLEE